MNTVVIDGKKTAQDIKEELKEKIAELSKDGTPPGLATILVGEDPGSLVYVKSKITNCNNLGIESFHNHLKEDSTKEEIATLIKWLNEDEKVSGILLQLPLPKKLPPYTRELLDLIRPDKDVDGLHPYNLGKLLSAKTWNEIKEAKILMPCTPSGIIEVIERYNIEVSGKKAIVIGRSNLVGKPIAAMLLSKNATVTMAHSKTKDLSAESKRADIIVAAIGSAKFINSDFVKEGAVIIDVGINRLEKGLVGDVDFEAVKDKASFITPVPGGIGAMTIAMLMKNTVMACEKQRNV